MAQTAGEILVSFLILTREELFWYLKNLWWMVIIYHHLKIDWLKADVESWYYTKIIIYIVSVICLITKKSMWWSPETQPFLSYHPRVFLLIITLIFVKGYKALQCISPFNHESTLSERLNPYCPRIEGFCFCSEIEPRGFGKYLWES